MVLSGTDLTNWLTNNDAYHFKGRPNQVIKRVAGNYTTTSTTFVDIDATNLAITLSIFSGKALVGFQGIFTSGFNNQGAGFDLMIDGVRYTSGSNGLFRTMTQPSGTILAAVYVLPITGLSQGSHVFKPQWYVTSSGGAGTLGGTANDPTTFWVTEIG
jgi:hypothetical protein